MTNYNPNRQPEGIPTGGQFAASTHSEPDVSIAARMDPDQEMEALIERVNAGDRTFTLTHVQYDDRLMDDQVKKYLNGGYDELQDEVLERFSEYDTESASEEVRDLLKEAGLDEGDIDTDKFDELAEVVRTKDDSDPLPALVRNTPEKLMRLTLGQPTESNLYDGNADGVEEAREAKIAAMLTDKGLDVSSPEAKEAIGELVANGPHFWHEGVDLDVIYFDDIRDSTIYNEETGEVSSREIQFKDPNILLLDRMNGSGHDVKIPGMIKATATEQSPVKLDADPDYGYGWDETAGVVHSAYRTDTANAWASPAPEAVAA